ncbi:aldolase catalytic domain-containing protein [Salegentibacter salegens]|uniref:4-hydroxy 2-oxovalerate aldolase n=1 Tax=Salegentibacter salegens TaxID=143223 RepID=A0A1M7HDI0_9FLAO|nr:aldolase catalytic domain-containing protein [Salegentibacter salegens]PRX43499.1 4-hydroxy 2-oxovalerate aldolase [Salegentibacter salegens]SHM26403.1 4-hydroxy 2-oxovalerate aldolase [Salegentibacter salegens]
MKLLDCTLRDGGYYTNWDFDRELVKAYFDAFNNLPIDYLEIGYRSNSMNSYLGEYFYCPQYVLEDAKINSSKKLVIILNEKDVRAEHVPDLLEPCVGYITMVRIAIDPKNFKRALSLAEAVKKLGFEVGFNVMYMSNWENEKEFLGQIKEINGIVDYFYMVDSFGGVYPEDVRKTFDIVRNQTDTKIGFHGHNNLQLALVNTLTAIDCGVSIVDTTVTGMGRGAGNLQTELLLTALNGKGELDLDFNALSKVVDPFEAMQKEYGWGTNLPYMVSGANSLPQKEVMSWVTKRFYSLNSIIRALSNQSKGIEDNIDLKNLEEEKKFKLALIIGGGPSGKKHAKAINEFIDKQEDICLIHSSSKNSQEFKDVHKLQIHCLAGNEGHRLEDSYSEMNIKDKLVVLPPYPRTMGTYIPESLEDVAFQLQEISFTDKFHESVTSLAIETALKLGVEKFYFAGYDGYSGEIKAQELELFNENEYIFERLKENGNYTPIAITPTLYDSLEPQSVFALI